MSTSGDEIRQFFSKNVLFPTRSENEMAQKWQCLANDKETQMCYTVIEVITMSELFNTAIVEKRNILNAVRSNSMTLQERRGTASEKRYLASPVLAHTVRITVVLPGFPLRDQRAGRSQ